eukprot:TRINITY_DN4161_c0_g1_i1.p1 TRINITY_DN4161_c0_g1~~TRINITY_DN4161_c0_g1_i1.p1  ORF type:complete len:314 (+),score=60.73 TRINITY_DN4161_c0_g1_i1:178-1119(+)
MSSLVIFSALLCVFSSFFTVSLSSNLYGMVTSSNIDKNMTMRVIEIDSVSGQFTPLIKTIVPQSTVWTGVSALDLKNNVFYYATDFTSTLIYAANLNTKKMDTPLSLQATFILSIASDPIKNALYVEYMDNEQHSIDTVNIGGSTEPLIDLTKEGIGQINSTAVDYVNGVYYFVSGDNLYSFPIENPSLTTLELDCGYQIYLSFNYAQNKLVAIGFTSNGGSRYYSYLEFTISNNEATCTAQKMSYLNDNQGVFWDYFLDPIEQIYYLSYTLLASQQNQIVTYDILNGNTQAANTSESVEELAAWYKYPKTPL